MGQLRDQRRGDGAAGLIILGLDPSLSSTGWGIIRAEGNRLSHIANGQMKTRPGEPLAWRLAELATARQRLGLSQRELSRRLELHPMTVMRLESGRRDLTLVEFVDLARTLGEEPGELLRRALDSEPDPARAIVPDDGPTVDPHD